MVFELPPSAPFGWVKERAYDAIIRLFAMLAPRLVTSTDPLPHVPAVWGARRCSQRAADALCLIPPDIDETELARRLHAFGAADNLQLRTVLHGRRFKLSPE